MKLILIPGNDTVVKIIDDDWKHVKRGTFYTRLNQATAQVSGEPLKDGDAVTVYQGYDGFWHVRRRSEFEDGRFIKT